MSEELILLWQEETKKTITKRDMKYIYLILQNRIDKVFLLIRIK